MAARMVLGEVWQDRYEFRWDEGYGDFPVEEEHADGFTTRRKPHPQDPSRLQEILVKKKRLKTPGFEDFNKKFFSDREKLVGHVKKLALKKGFKLEHRS